MKFTTTTTKKMTLIRSTSIENKVKDKYRLSNMVSKIMNKFVT